jgi:hypothetical protein
MSGCGQVARRKLTVDEKMKPLKTGSFEPFPGITRGEI